MAARSYQVELTGETPLLMHFDNLDWAEVLKTWRTDPANRDKSTAGDDRSPAWGWIGSLYTDAGRCVIPADNLMTMLREGGKKCPTGKGQETFKARTQSGIVVDQVAWPLTIRGAEVPYAPIKSLIEKPDFEAHQQLAGELGFMLFVKRAKIGAAKHVRVRPRFDHWECAGTLTVFDEMITTRAITDILASAGRYAGLGDWRPSSPKSPGPYGKFTAAVKEI